MAIGCSSTASGQEFETDYGTETTSDSQDHQYSYDATLTARTVDGTAYEQTLSSSCF